MRRHREKAEPRREAPEEPALRHLELGFQPAELRGDNFLWFKLPRLW